MPATVLQIGPYRACSKCKETKLVECFSPAPRVKSGLQRECKACVVDRAAAWEKANPARVSVGKRNRRYSIDFNDLWEKQGGLCAMCHEPMLPKGKTARSVVVDHDHRCSSARGHRCNGCVRGLIHSRCNIILGVLEKEGRTLNFAKEFLKKYEEGR